MQAQRTTNSRQESSSTFSRLFNHAGAVMLPPACGTICLKQGRLAFLRSQGGAVGIPGFNCMLKDHDVRLAMILGETSKTARLGGF